MVGVTAGEVPALVGQPITVTAAVQNFGRSERRAVDVVLEVERPPGAVAPPPPPREQVVRRIDAIPPGEQAGVSFALKDLHGFRDRGPHVLRVRLAEGDRLEADDSRAVVVEVRDKVSVVLVNGRPDAEPLRRASEYLARALEPPGAKPAADAGPSCGRSRRPSSPTPAWATCRPSIACCCATWPTVTPALAARLESHLKRGGGVVVGLGPNAAANRDGVQPGAVRRRQRAAARRCSATWSAGGPDDPGFRLAADDEAYRRPAAGGVRATGTPGPGWSRAPFRYYVRLDAAGGRPGPAGAVVRPREGGRRAGGPADRGRPTRRWSSGPGTAGGWSCTPARSTPTGPTGRCCPSYLPFAHELLRFAVVEPGPAHRPRRRPAGGVLPARGRRADRGPRRAGRYRRPCRWRCGTGRAWRASPTRRWAGCYRLGLRRGPKPGVRGERAGGQPGRRLGVGPAAAGPGRPEGAARRPGGWRPGGDPAGGRSRRRPGRHRAPALGAGRRPRPGPGRLGVGAGGNGAGVAVRAGAVSGGRRGPTGGATDGGGASSARSRGLACFSPAASSWAPGRTASSPASASASCRTAGGGRWRRPSACRRPRRAKGRGGGWKARRRCFAARPPTAVPHGAVAALAGLLIVAVYRLGAARVGSARHVVLPALLLLAAFPRAVLVLPQLRLAFDREGLAGRGHPPRHVGEHGRRGRPQRPRRARQGGGAGQGRRTPRRPTASGWPSCC